MTHNSLRVLEYALSNFFLLFLVPKTLLLKITLIAFIVYFWLISLVTAIMNCNFR